LLLKIAHSEVEHKFNTQDSATKQQK